MIALILIGYLVLIWVTLPKLLKARQIRETVAFCLFTALAMTLCILELNDYPIPNPFNAFNHLLDLIGLHY
jgi:hypothetical protein